jgi:hypothetical protein
VQPFRSLDPKLPEDVAIAGVDGKQWTVAAGALRERARHTVEMLHDETENPVDMVKVFEGRVLIRYPDSRRLEATRQA